jgi:hypothetical protein
MVMLGNNRTATNASGTQLPQLESITQVSCSLLVKSEKGIFLHSQNSTPLDPPALMTGLAPGFRVLFGLIKYCTLLATGNPDSIFI